MFYILEEGLFKSRSERKLLQALDRLKLEYEWVKVLPFINTMEFQTERKDVMCFGSTKMSTISKQYNWYPGSFFNENHDYEIYSTFYKNHLLNYDSKIISVKDEIDFIEPLMFIRPCKDSKLFTGKCFDKKDWEEEVDKISCNWPDKLNDKIQVSKPKHIQQEFRCWVVKGECISISQYKLGNSVVYQNYDNDEVILNFVNDMISIYQPAEAFVIDICFTSEGIKVVEINNLNSAGFYDGNLQKVIMSLEENFG